MASSDGQYLCGDILILVIVEHAGHFACCILNGTISTTRQTSHSGLIHLILKVSDTIPSLHLAHVILDLALISHSQRIALVFMKRSTVVCSGQIHKICALILRQ